MLMLLRANKKHKVCVSIDENIGIDKEGNELTIRDIIPQKEEDDPDKVVERKVLMQEIVEKMKELLNEREFLIISLRYGVKDGVEHTQNEVATMLNISRSYVSRIENKALQLIKEDFKNGKYYDEYRLNKQ